MVDMSKTAIVTGVTGQMGSYFVEFLLKKGIKVVGTVRRLSVKNHENIDHITDPLFSLAPMDLGDSHSINSLVQAHKPDYFINCAANSFVGSSWDYPEQHFEYNTLGVLRQLEAIKRFSPTTRYINFGSSEEFGDVQYSPQDEKHPGRARSPYGASKIGARQIVKVYRESFNLFALQCWCFNYESPRRGPEFVTRKITLGVARIVKAIQEGKSFEPIELGNLDAKRDWSHAEDFVEGIWRMLNQDDNIHHKCHVTGIQMKIGSPGKVESCANGNYTLTSRLEEYVFASGETHTVREFVEKAFDDVNIHGTWMGAGQEEVFMLTPQIDTWSALVRINPEFYRPCEVDLLLGDPSRAKRELGWEPRVSFDELISRMVASDLK